MYSNDATLHGTPVEGKDGKTWFGYEQATDADGNLLWDETKGGEAAGVPLAKTEKKTVDVIDEKTGEPKKNADGTTVTKEIDVPVRATKVVAPEGDEAFNWHFDRFDTYQGKKNAFIEILAGIVTPLEGVLNFLLRGDSLRILPEGDDGAVLELYGNKGYENVIMPLFQALGVDQIGGTIVSAKDYEDGRGTDMTLYAITEGIFSIIEAITLNPLEYIFTLLPSLSYFISCNGPETVLNNLLSPVLALLNLAYPIVGDLLDDLIGASISDIFGDFMPDTINYTVKVNKKSPVYKTTTEVVDGVETEVKIKATTTSEKVTYEDKTYYITAGDGKGEVIADAYVVEYDEAAQAPVFNTYKAYALTDLLKICGEYGENLVNIINNLFGTLLLGKDATEEELAAFKLLDDTFFADYAAQALTVNKQKDEAKFYYFVETADGSWIKVRDLLYKSEMGTIKETHYVVDWFKVDIADSAVFLLDNVLSETLLREIAKLAKIDLTDEDNILAAIIKNLINNDNPGLIITSIITALFENYTIKYNELYGEFFTPDHSHLDNLKTEEDKTKAAAVPGQLDKIIKNALPAVAPILSKLLAPKDGKKPTILNDIVDKFDTIANTTDEVADLYEVAQYLLDELVLSDELVNTLAALIVNLIGGTDIIGTIIEYFGLTGIKLDPQSYLATVEKAYTVDDMKTAVAAFKSIIGEATTWADVVRNDTTPLYAYEYATGENDDKGNPKKATVYLADANATTYELTKTVGEGEAAKEVKDEVALTQVLTEDGKRVVKAEYNNVVDGKKVAELNWGVNNAKDKKDAFIKALSVIIEPLFPVLQLVLQGKILTLVGHNKKSYTPVNMVEYNSDGTHITIEDDSRTGEEIGNGYIELMGVNGYEELLVPLLDALGGIEAFKAYDEDNNPDGIMTADEFNGLANAYDMLDYIVNVVFAFVNNLVASPVTYLANYLPSLLYFIGSDGVYNAVQSVLQLVNGLIAVVEPLIGPNGIKLSDTLGLPLDLLMLKLDDSTVPGKVQKTNVDGKYAYIAKNDETKTEIYLDKSGLTKNGDVEIEAVMEDGFITVKGLCSMINDLIKKPDFINKTLLLKLAGYLGDFEVISTVRRTAGSLLYDTETEAYYRVVEVNGKNTTILVAQKEGKLWVDDLGNTVNKPVDKDGKITTIVGDTQYTLTGLLQFALADGLVSGFVDTSKMEGILKTILDNVMGPNATENVAAILIKLLNKYVITYEAIEEPAGIDTEGKSFAEYLDALVAAENTKAEAEDDYTAKTAKEIYAELEENNELKLDQIAEALTYFNNAVEYGKYGVEKAEVQLALNNIQALIPEILALLNVGSLESLIADNLYTDNIANLLVGLLVGLLGGLDDKTWNTITEILGYVKDIVGLNIDISPAAYAVKDNVFKPFIDAVNVERDVKNDAGEVTGKERIPVEDLTWSDVANFYTKYEYK